MPACVDPADLERYATGALPENEAEPIRRHLETCDLCRTLHDRTVGRLGTDATVSIAMDATQTIASDEGVKSKPALKRPDKFPSIEGYSITGVLGQGGMGVVYRAVQTKLNRVVALKVLPAMVGAASPSAVARFEREATAAARLHHTNIVPIYDFGESPDGNFFAMELIEGEPLDVLILRFAEQNAAAASTGRLARLLRTSTPDGSGFSGVTAPSQSAAHSFSTTVTMSLAGSKNAYYLQVARWTADTADALHYAHGQQIIHRDVKPANLILSVDGRIMLADFGLAKSAETESITMTGTMVGTLRYMSPEQTMAKRARIDHRTDIYSLGATLYELLCFRPAFTGDDQKSILSAIISREPTRPRKHAPSVPPELETICLKCMEKMADSRYETGQALAEDLRRYINDLPIAAKRPGPIRRTLKLIRRHKAASVAIASLVLLAAAVGVSIRLQRQREVALAESRIAQAQALTAHVEGLVAEGLRLQAAPTTTKAATREKLQSAGREFQTALELDATHWRALSNLAIVKKEIYNNQIEPDASLLEEAIILCDRALAAEQQSPELWNLKGVLLKKLERFEEALIAYRIATELAPKNFAVWNNLGITQALAGKLETGETSLALAADLTGVEDPCNVHVWRNLASLQLVRNNAEAVTSIGHAITCGPGDAWANVLRARLRLSPLGDFDSEEALIDMKLANRLASQEDPRLTRMMSLALLRNNRFADAIGRANVALEMGGMITLNQLIVAIAEAKLGHFDLARNAYRAASDSWPEDLTQVGQFRAGAPGGVLWFETTEELRRYRKEAEAVSGYRPESP